jgi:hypothetical protein
MTISTATSNPAAAPDNAAELLSSRSVIFELYVSAPLWRRPMPLSGLIGEEQDGADPDLIHVSKDLIDRKALIALNSHAAAFKEWLRVRSVPCRLLRGGMRLMPNAMVLEVDERAQAFIAERQALVAALVEVYSGLKVDAARRLGKHYREEEYPDPRILELLFNVRTNWLSIDIPRALEQLNVDLYAREKARVELEWREAYGEIRDALRASFAGLVGHLADRLGTKEDGKRMVLRDSAIVKVREFIDTFAARNLTGDEELADLAAKARNLIAGVEPDDIRSVDMIRERVRTGMEEIKVELDAMIVPAPRRRFAANTDGRV